MARILVIAPHADDEVLGLGGTIARLNEEGNEIIVAIMTGHGEHPHPIWPEEMWKTVRKEALEAHKILGVKKTIFRELPAAIVSDQSIFHVNKIVDEVIREIEPDQLFIPFLYDLHRDHREIVHSASVAWRPTGKAGKNIKEIYMYETLSETHWNIQQQEGGFLPNFFVNISKGYLQKKMDALSIYKSQIRDFPDARSVEAIEALAKFRGCMIGVNAAEAFILVRKIY